MRSIFYVVNITYTVGLFHFTLITGGGIPDMLVLRLTIILLRQASGKFQNIKYANEN